MNRLRAAMAGLLLFMVVAHDVPPASAVASAGCAPDIGDRQPVLLVHGFRSNEGTWAEGRPSMIRALRVVPGLYVRTFDYSRVNTAWVDNSLIGRPLADRILCLAGASAAAGGPGRVIVVGHSMGGLAIRDAAARTVDQVRVADRIGLIITIGTPNLGSFLRGNAVRSGGLQALGVILRTVCEGGALTTLGRAQPLCDSITELANSQAGVAFTPGSRELAALPSAPANVPLRAVVGSVDHVSLAVFHGHITVKEPGDLVVAEDSASVGARDRAHGGGLVKVRCPGWELLVGLRTLPDCSHTLEPQSIDVQQAVTAGIRTYLAGTEPPRPPGLASGKLPESCLLTNEEASVLAGKPVAARPAVEGWDFTPACFYGPPRPKGYKGPLTGVTIRIKKATGMLLPGVDFEVRDIPPFEWGFVHNEANEAAAYTRGGYELKMQVTGDWRPGEPAVAHLLPEYMRKAMRRYKGE